MTPSAPAPARTAPTPPARGRIRAPVAFDHLGRREAAIRFEVHGTVSRSRHPAVVLGGISAGRHLAPAPFDPSPGWWPGVVGPGGALDPDRRPLVGLYYLGGAGRPGKTARTDPARTRVAARRCLRPVTTHDQARAVAAVLDHLGIAAASFVGASYGGMVALAFAELFPARVRRLVVLCAAHRTHPMATAVRSVQRAAVSLGADAGDPARGLALARALAMTTYRSAREFEERFSPFALRAGTADAAPGVTPGAARARFPVEEYLEARGTAFVRACGAERFLALSESIDLHGTRPGSLPAHALLVSFDSDVLAPPWLMEELAARQGRSRARHLTIATRYGHDAFLKETEAVSGCLRRELAGEEVAR
ncbi:MAG: alpha/beta fold hydrolase [Gemmatimonadota bacterium]|nr:alpha/beta fold hydrolase [Gemmatimonadota bacterium]